MKILVSLASGQDVQTVLRKIGQTIKSDTPGRSKLGTGTYSPASCYGAIAHYMRENPGLDPGLTIVMFGVGLDDDQVAHAVLFDTRSGHSVVDTYAKHGLVRRSRQGVVTGYLRMTPREVLYPRISMLTVAEFRRRFM